MYRKPSLKDRFNVLVSQKGAMSRNEIMRELGIKSVNQFYNITSQLKKEHVPVKNFSGKYSIDGNGHTKVESKPHKDVVREYLGENIYEKLSQLDNEQMAMVSDLVQKAVFYTKTLEAELEALEAVSTVRRRFSR